MRMTDKETLIQSTKDALKLAQKNWYDNQTDDNRAVLGKAYDEVHAAEIATIDPEVGLGATGGYGSDCYPYTIVSVSKDGKKIEVTADDHTPAPGFDYYSNQEYIYTSNMNGPRTMYRLRKNGRWVRQGESMNGGSSISIGHRRYYQDPSY